MGLFKLNETAQSVLALTKFVSFFVFRSNFVHILVAQLRIAFGLFA
ncbi:hypothetical protein CFter6_3376 [Collimonas fungivorans]|uniref:Uncharacterized protein n=1 Tax=Collimonas fungivorans TaxID=158899 RepID=A0A127PDW7_9BURK|nr:hypothetical protein CFter6_3376 [Collimonas fungivorans]